MHIKLFTQFDQLKNNHQFQTYKRFLSQHPHGNFFQSPEFFHFIEDIEGYKAFQILAISESGEILGSLLGTFQSNGANLKSWLSRRLIVWGGPLVARQNASQQAEVITGLLMEMKKHASGSAIYAEFRNFFDTSEWQNAFAGCGFKYKPHLNYLVKTDAEAAVKKRMSSSRMRQIKSSLKAGARIVEAGSEADVMDYYYILKTLYREKVKKPLPNLELFLKFWKSSICKFFIVKREDEVIGGIVCPIYENKVIYEWYVCGKDGMEKGLHPSVLATWAPIEYGFQNGFEHFDFMGAGKPDEDYGVREFKARFGGEEVCFGRYEMILNKSLYNVGKFGLKMYQKIKS